MFLSTTVVQNMLLSTIPDEKIRTVISSPQFDDIACMIFAVAGKSKVNESVYI